jgi:hypothetical protein
MSYWGARHWFGSFDNDTLAVLGQEQQFDSTGAFVRWMRQALCSYSREQRAAVLSGLLKTLQQMQLASLAIALLCSSEDHLHQFRQQMLLVKCRSDGFAFRDVRTQLDKACVLATRYRMAKLMALLQLVKEQRIDVQDTTMLPAVFVALCNALPKDIVRNIIVPHIGRLHCTHDDEKDCIVCKDTVQVWMRCRILNREVTPDGRPQMFVHYENWTERWDEWIAENDATRVEPWIDPCERARVYTWNDALDAHLVKLWKLEIMLLLRNGREGTLFQMCEEFV